MTDQIYEGKDQSGDQLSADVSEMLGDFDQAGLPPAGDTGPKGEPMGGVAGDPYRPVDPRSLPPGPLGMEPVQPPQPGEPPQPPPQEPPPAAEPPAPEPIVPEPSEVPPTDPAVAALQAKVAMYEQMLRGAATPGVPGQPGLPPGMATPMAQPGMPPLPGQPATLPQAQPPLQPQAQPAPQPMDFFGGKDPRDMEPAEFNQRLAEGMAARDRVLTETILSRTAEVATNSMAQMAQNTMAYDNHVNATGNEWVKENQAGFDWCLQTTQNMYPHLAHDMPALCNTATEMLRGQMTQAGQPPATTAPGGPPTQAAPRVPRVAPAAPTRVATGQPKPQGQDKYMAEFGVGWSPEGF